MQEIIGKLANGVIAGPDDLMGIGECLNLMEQLESDASLSEEQTENIARLKQLFNGVILGESPNVAEDWSLILKLIDDLCHCTGGNGQCTSLLTDCQQEELGGYGADREDDTDAPASTDGSSDTDWQAIQRLLNEVCSDEPPAPEQVNPEPDAPVRGAGSTNAILASNAKAPEIQEEAAELLDPDLIRDFLEESSEHLASIELNILALEENPANMEAINAVFRPFHSIKGVAGFLNLKDIHRLTHEVENLLDDARSQKIVVTDVVIDIILQSVDILKGLLEHVHIATHESSPLRSSREAVDVFLEQVGNSRRGDGGLGGAPNKKLGEILIERGIVEPEVVEKAAIASKTKGKKIGEVLIHEGAVSPKDVSGALREQRLAKESAASVRIDTLKLDNLVDMVGELVIAQSMVLQNELIQNIKDQKYQKDSVQLRRITNELQRIAMSMRMVPIKSTFQKMIRLVRDLCKKSGKEAVLEMKGEDTEMDRNMVEEIYEPLVHMIRNSIDHGIEPPEERQNLGKNSNGTIVISAEQKGGNILIDIKDDGRGLDADKIRAKAIERKIISGDDQLDQKAIYDLIFHPGFSTKEVITDVSGRGVGMDVVKKSVESLRGKIEIFNYPGKGSHFQFKLPLTMAIIDGMIVRVGTERYIVPTISLKESFRPEKDAYLTVHGKGETIRVRDSLMPLVRLHELFDVEPRFRNPWDGLLLVVNEDGASYCLLADEIVGRQEVVIKSLGSTLQNVNGVSGGVILGDGRVALIIDVKGVVSHYESSSNAR
ncbi:MAG: chemotaxis protein CheW [Syntrophobacteraceae bacterium]